MYVNKVSCMHSPICWMRGEVLIATTRDLVLHVRPPLHKFVQRFTYLVGNFGSEESAAQKNEKAHGKDESLQKCAQINFETS